MIERDYYYYFVFFSHKNNDLGNEMKVFELISDFHGNFNVCIVSRRFL